MPIRILVVDDEPDLELLIDLKFQKQVQSGEMELHYARNGVEALEKLDAVAEVDFVLTDINMPVMNGLTLLEKLKERESPMPAVVLSAYGDMKNIRAAMNRGAFDFLTKPIDFEDMEVTFAKTLEHGRRLREGVQAREFRLAKEVAEEKLNKLEELELLRESLAQMIVHDLRVPLTALLTGTQTVAMLGDLNEDQKTCLALATQGGESLLAMVNDLLDIARLESDALQLRYEDVAVAEVVAYATQQVAALASFKQQNLLSHVAPDSGSVRADPDKLRRILLNLVGNAVKFTARGGTISIAAYAQPDKDAVLFTISDTGDGIPQSAFGTIFEKFGQVHPTTSAHHSSGLGLYFCKTMTEAHGGRLWVESIPNQGSTFSLLMPRQPEPPEPAPNWVRRT